MCPLQLLGIWHEHEPGAPSVRFKIEVALASKALTIIIGGGGSAMVAASKQSVALAAVNLFALATSMLKGFRAGLEVAVNTL